MSVNVATTMITMVAMKGDVDITLTVFNNVDDDEFENKAECRIYYPFLCSFAFSSMTMRESRIDSS